MSRREDLAQRQSELWARMQEIQNRADSENRDWTAEERQNWDAAEADLTTVSRDIERIDRAAQLSAVDYRQVVDAGGSETEQRDEDRGQEYRDAFLAYVRHGQSGMTPQQRSILETGAVQPESRALSHTNSAGGYLVPTDVDNRIREVVVSYGGLLQLANVVTTNDGATMQWPTGDDTGNVGAILGENTQIAEQDTTFGQAAVGAYTFTSKLVRVPWQLLQDSAIDLEAYLARILGERLGRVYATYLVSGTGSSQPQGLVAGATAGVTGATSAQPAITYDNLIDLEHSIDPVYRQRARYVLSDGALKLLRKLKDADGRPIWNPVPTSEFGPTINGYPYAIDNTMATPAASARSIVFGDINEAYLVRLVRGTQLVTLKERYADFLQNGYFAYQRMDAMVQNAAAVRVFIHGAAS